MLENILLFIIKIICSLFSSYIMLYLLGCFFKGIYMIFISGPLTKYREKSRMKKIPCIKRELDFNAQKTYIPDETVFFEHSDEYLSVLQRVEQRKKYEEEFRNEFYSNYHPDYSQQEREKEEIIDEMKKAYQKQTDDITSEIAFWAWYTTRD